MGRERGEGGARGERGDREGESSGEAEMIGVPLERLWIRPVRVFGRSLIRSVFHGVRMVLYRPCSSFANY